VNPFAMTTHFHFHLGFEPIIFEGRTLGTIVPSRGPKVFGWDAVFEPVGYNMTYVPFNVFYCVAKTKINICQIC